MAAKRRKNKHRPVELPLQGLELSADPPQPEIFREERAFQHLFLEQCLDAASWGAKLIPEKREEQPPPGEDSSGTCPFLFDIINCRVSGLEGSGESEAMPVYLAEEGMMRCNHSRGVYSGPQVSCYELFCEKREKGVRQQVLSMSIRDVVGGRLPAPGHRFMCLMPDMADDFDQTFRNQLNCQGTVLFPVPRSVALAYTLQEQEGEVPPEFLCLEYDDEAFWAVKVCKIEGENGFLVRMGRENVEGTHLSYRALANCYLDRYQKKYKIELTKQARSNLIDTKALQQLMFDQNVPLLIDNGGKVLAVRQDEDILRMLRQQLEADIKQIRTQTKLPVYPLCSFFGGVEDGLFTIRQLEQGCLGLCGRADWGETLWQEYLPHLELEVNRDGIFDIIELIGEKDRRQNVSTFLNTRVEIPVSNGIIWFPANGEKHYDLPLIREVYGYHDRDKLAEFKLEKPLEEDTQVELTVYYRYGDIDSYQLVAKGKDMIFTSAWCNAERLDNQAPSFQEQRRQHFISQAEAKEVVVAFQNCGRKIRLHQRSQKLRYNAVYTKRNKDYSKYLHELNELNGQKGWPYFIIQNFFRIESKEDTEQYVSELLNDEVFDIVAGVLFGTLPTGHELGMDENSGQDEGKVLVQNMAEIACQMGYFYCLSEDLPEAFQAAEDILEYFREKQYHSLQYWAPITKYVRREQDSHRIWDSFSEALKQLNYHKQDMYGLRSISGVCFQTENWIFDFFHGPNGRAEVDLLVRSILNVLNSQEWLRRKNGSEKYNPRMLRDILELLLCICRLKSEDPTILDCNEAQTKALVKRLKEVDRMMRDLDEKKLLEYSFNSRLGIDSPDAYRRVNPVIYALIQTLTGGKTVSLMGFSEDDR